MYRNILIPTDGSELAERAVSHGLALAKSVGAKVTTICVESPPQAVAISSETVQGQFAEHVRQAKQHAASALGRVTDWANAAGVPCEAMQVEHDQAHQAIATAAIDRNCDLIVIGSHGRSGLSAVLLGGVAQRVLALTKVPVLICR